MVSRSRPFCAVRAAAGITCLLLAWPALACGFRVKTGEPLNFGTLQAGSRSAAIATAMVPDLSGTGVDDCKRARSLVLSVLAGNAHQLTSGANRIPYQVGFGRELSPTLTVTGQGAGQHQPVMPPLTAIIPAGALVHAVPGTYTDTLILQVMP